MRVVDTKVLERSGKINNIPETDQWLLDGICNKCRRESYCRKKCGAVKRAWRAWFKKAVAEALVDKMDKDGQTVTYTTGSLNDETN